MSRSYGLSTARLFLTALSDDRPLGEREALPVHAPTTTPSLAVVVDTARPFQELLGFGGAFTEAASTTLDQMSPQRRQEFFRAYFDTNNGHGYSFCRTHINSCDFALGNYAYTETPEDTTLEHFTIERDRKSLLPMIKEAIAIRGADEIKLFASPWSPPAWMKTTGRMNNGGSLKPEYRDTWAKYYCRYIQAMADEGVALWGLTVQNEPDAAQEWDSCLYSAQEEADFVKHHLGPALHEAGLGYVKLMIWDHNRDKLFDRAKVAFDDPETAKYVWGAAFHWYGQDHFDHVQMVHDLYPDKALVFSEGCQEGGPHAGSWELGERYARSIIHDLNRGTVAWTDWNLLLNKEGGPNHVDNLCSAPILADTANDQFLYQSSYWYLGHFARFMKPGARRVLCRASEGLLALAAKNPDETIAVVVLNLSEDAKPVLIRSKHAEVNTHSPPRSIITTVFEPGALETT